MVGMEFKKPHGIYNEKGVEENWGDASEEWWDAFQGEIVTCEEKEPLQEWKYFLKEDLWTGDIVSWKVTKEEADCNGNPQQEKSVGGYSTFPNQPWPCTQEKACQICLHPYHPRYHKPLVVTSVV